MSPFKLVFSSLRTVCSYIKEYLLLSFESSLVTWCKYIISFNPQNIFVEVRIINSTWRKRKLKAEWVKGLVNCHTTIKRYIGGWVWIQSIFFPQIHTVFHWWFLLSKKVYSSSWAVMLTGDKGTEHLGLTIQQSFILSKIQKAISQGPNPSTLCPLLAFAQELGLDVWLSFLLSSEVFHASQFIQLSLYNLLSSCYSSSPHTKNKPWGKYQHLSP